MENIVKLIAEQGVMIVIVAIVILYAAKLLFQDEPKEKKKLIENNTQAMADMADSAKVMADVVRTLNEENKLTNRLLHKILTCVKVADEKNNTIIQLLLKENAAEIIEKIDETLQEEGE